jgi:iron-sulfur cluster repair protein YtfE (RIC family)
MKLHPDTTIRKLVVALPSSSALLARMGLSSNVEDDRSLRQACADAGISIEALFEALDTLDWDAEPQSL